MHCKWTRQAKQTVAICRTYFPFLCFLQPHTPKSCFCKVWRKPTTSSHCSSLTQGCHLCPTAQRLKFRCASVQRPRDTAALPTPTALALLCCLQHSCSSHSVSTIKLHPPSYIQLKLFVILELSTVQIYNMGEKLGHPDNELFQKRFWHPICFFISLLQNTYVQCLSNRTGMQISKMAESSFFSQIL